jgi:YVTN family beta-propeller protein
MVEEHRNYHGKYLLALVFSSIFLFSFGILIPNVFAAQVVATIPVGTEPLAIAANPNSNKIFVANTDSNNVSVIDGATNSVIDTIPVGSGPHNVKVNPITNMIYVSLFSGGISVIDGKTDTVVSTISGINPNAIAINPNTNLIYATVRGVGVYIINGTTNTASSKSQYKYDLCADHLFVLSSQLCRSN